MKTNRSSKWLLRLLTVLALTVLSGCFPSKDPAGPGNGEGYGFVNIVVEKNKTKAFSIFPEGRKPVPGATFTVHVDPEHGQVQELSADQLAQGNYTPSKDYIGLDHFQFTINYPDGLTEPVDAFVDVSPCLRLPADLPLSDGLHIVSTMEPRVGAPIPVTVLNDGKAKTLYLTSRESVEWQLQLQEGANVQKVVVFAAWGMHPSVTGIDPSKVSYRITDSGSYSDSWTPYTFADRPGEYFRGGSDFGFFIRNIRSLEGKAETSYQGCVSAASFQIPYSPNSLAKTCGRTSYYQLANQNCTDKCKEVVLDSADHTQWRISSHNGFKEWEPEISQDGLSLTVNHGAGWSAATTNTALSCGKHYFEITIQKPAGHRPYSQFALTFDPRSPVPVVNRGIVGERVYTDFNQGDVLGVALDLDAGTIAYSKNGIWEDQTDPGAGKGLDLGLYIYAPIYIEADTYDGMRERANFGSEAFKYSVPTGFNAGFKASKVANVIEPKFPPVAHKTALLGKPGHDVFERLPGIPYGGDPMTFELGEGPNKGVVTLMDAQLGDIRYSADANASGLDQFTYRVRQGDRVSEYGMVHIELQAASTERLAQASANAEVHYVGNYGASGELAAEPLWDVFMKQTEVHVTRVGRPIVLVLTNYDSVEWHVTTAPGVVIERILQSSYHRSRVVADAMIPVTQSNYTDRLSPNLLLRPAHYLGCEWDLTKTKISQIFGLAPMSAQSDAAFVEVGAQSNKDLLKPDPNDYLGRSCGNY